MHLCGRCSGYHQVAGHGPGKQPSARVKALADVYCETLQYCSRGVETAYHPPLEMPDPTTIERL